MQFTSAFSPFLFWHTNQQADVIHHFWVHWTGSPIQHHLIRLEDPLCWGKIQSFLYHAFHLTAVAIFQGMLLIMNLRPSSSYSLDQDKMTWLFYILVIPTLTPLIYSLQKKDVKEALEKPRQKRWILVTTHRHTGSVHFYKIMLSDTQETKPYHTISSSKISICTDIVIRNITSNQVCHPYFC